MKRYRILLMTAVLALSGGACGLDGAPEEGSAQGTDVPSASTAGGPVCQVIPGSTFLPDEMRETSGLAASRISPDRFWTHNDAGSDPELFAIARDGSLQMRVRIRGAELEDWEDVAAGPCASGSCLFIADTGDNAGDRDHITVYELPEPEAGATESAPALAFHARFPDGRWDTESIFVTDEGIIYLVTKGREGPIALYRYPAIRPAGSTVTLERVRELFAEADSNADRITGAGLSPDGGWVGVRSNRFLYLYRGASLLSGTGPITPTTIDLRPLEEPQGESLAITSDGTVWLTSEAESNDARPMLTSIRCTFPA